MVTTRIHLETKDGHFNSIRLAPETEQRLDFLAAQTGRTKTYYLREIIEQGLEDLEDYYLAAEVLERIRKVRKGCIPRTK